MPGGIDHRPNGAARTRFLPYLVALAAFAGCGSAAAAKGDAGELAISVAQPPDFAVLAGRQVMVVDLFFAGRALGEAQIETEGGQVVFADPAGLARLIPGLKDAAEVETLLSRTLPANAPRVCSLGSDRSTCGRLVPEDLGIIFDRDNFRVDLFLNPRLLELDGAAATYLPVPETGLSLLSAIRGVVSGSVGQGDSLYDLTDRLLIGWGPSRLVADLGYSSEVGLRAEELVVQVDRPELRLLAGAFWAPGTELVGRRKLLGAGIETQIDTRLDKEQIRANPIVVFLAQRSRIDIVRDGRILTSRVYEAGNQRLDTAGLPDGAYEILLRITGTDGSAREEARFFNKSRTLPSPGRQEFFAFAGVAIDDPDAIEPTRAPFAQAGWARRLGEHVAVDATATYLDDEFAMQAGGTLITPAAVVRGAVLATSEGTRGGMVQMSSGGYSRLNFSAEFRHIEVRGQPRFLSGVTFDLRDPVAGFAADAGAHRSHWQAGATVSWGFADVQVFGSGYYRRIDNRRASYGIGPSIRWEVLQRGPLRLAVSGNAAFTERGTTAYLGVGLSLTGARSHVAANVGRRLSDLAGEAEGFAGAVSGSWHTRSFGTAEVDLGAGYEREPGRDNLTMSGQIRGSAMTLRGDVIHSRDDALSRTQYVAGAETLIAVGPDMVELQSRTAGESMLVVRLDGAREGDRFEVLLDGTPSGEIAGGESLSLSLPSYRAYDVRLRSLGAQLVAYDNASRRVGLYPGSVQKLEWEVRPIRIIVGRLLFDDGSPVAHARLKSPGGLAETDVAGNFQIEVTGDGPLEVALLDGTSHRVSLPPARTDVEWAMVGDLRCCAAPAGAALARAKRPD